ncbi:hypothetical protein EOL70_01050 [Leucothrix sargassi]|nr:hypothetical protein EOL70_01050 [Leucothrix sargassi]
MKNNQIVATVALSALFAFVSAHAKSKDPITASEQAIASALVMPSLQTTTALASRSVNTSEASTTTTVSSNVQFLKVQPHRFEKGDTNSGARWSDVTAYDYDSDELIVNVVDLDTESIVSTKRFTNMQPPLVQDELDRALSIVMDDEEERSILDSEFKRITGQTLASIDQLQYKAFTFFADSMPTVVNEASKSCGANRCAQLVLFTHDNIVFEVSPIVNLSAGVVTQRMGY